MKKKRKIPIAHNSSGKKKRRNMGTGSYMPLPQQADAKKMYAEGKSINEIAREMKKDWKTIAKVVRTEDMERYLEEMERRVAELVPDALNTLSTSIKVGKHKAQLSYGLVRDFVLRRRAQQQQMIPAQMTQQLMDEREEQGVKSVIAAFTEIAIETHRIFNIPMPELDEAKQKVSAKKLEVRMSV